jgi:dihydrodipicolinate synthase/N-acetylneuraminate lyase
MLAHCRVLADELPVVGFYLQPAVGGVVLSRAFWEQLAAIENVIGIKVAPFDRYRTLDVLHGVAAAGAQERISLYTGNDDHIVLDLTVPFRTEAGESRFVGGLLGHWSVWTRTAVEILERCRGVRDLDAVPADLLALDSAVTDCNAAFFDVANAFHGVIAGCHEVLRRQGLLAGRWCLDPSEDLSPGQAEDIDRVYRSYPELSDDEFVAANLERWLGSE